MSCLGDSITLWFDSWLIRWSYDWVFIFIDWVVNNWLPNGSVKCAILWVDYCVIWWFYIWVIRRLCEIQILELGDQLSWICGLFQAWAIYWFGDWAIRFICDFVFGWLGDSLILWLGCWLIRWSVDTHNIAKRFLTSCTHIYIIFN